MMQIPAADIQKRIDADPKLRTIQSQKKSADTGDNSPLAHINLVCADDLIPEPIRWLWPGWLPRGKLTILAGDGGTGKTTLAINLGATVTIAGRWPDGSPCRDVGNVIVWSSEDDPKDTLTPRFMAANADRGRIYFIQGAKDPGGESVAFDPATDIAMLDRAIASIGGVALLIIDPVVCAVSGDMHKANDVRRSLQPIVDLAAKYRCAVIGISHYSKGSKGSSPTERVIGSQAFSALARMVLVTAKEEEGNERVLARSKSNISADTGGFAYTIEPVTISDNIDTTVCRWGGAIEGTAREILGDVESGTEQASADQSSEAEGVLRDILHLGEMRSNEVKIKMKSEGFSDKVIRTASDRLDVIKRPEGFGKDRKTFWRLPTSSYMPSNSINAQPQEQGIYASSGHVWSGDNDQREVIEV